MLCQGYPPPMPASWPGSWRKFPLGIHLLFSALPLMFLAWGLLGTAGEGFHRSPTLYPRPFFDPEETAQYLVDSWKARPLPLKERIVAVWGLADAPEGGVDPESPSIVLALALARAGVQIRVSDPGFLEEAKPLLGERIAFFPDPMAALEGAHGGLLATEWPAYLEVDFAEVASRMAGREVLDCRAAWDGEAVDGAGLFHLVYAKPSYPPWLDPELLAFARHVKSKVGEEEGILMVPDGRLGTLSGRARWFLHLNYLLFPRRLYLRKPELACGTSGQYREWVLDWNRERPWKGTRRLRLGDRALSGVVDASPIRSLTPDETKALATLNADWVLYWTHNSDFRITDWECVPAGALP